MAVITLRTWQRGCLASLDAHALRKSNYANRVLVVEWAVEDFIMPAELYHSIESGFLKTWIQTNFDNEEGETTSFDIQ